MQITLKNIIPNVIKSPKNSQIWNTEINFLSGENYLVKAPSGKGKSTFAKIIGGQNFDYLGQVSWGKKPINCKIDKQPFFRNTFSFIWQDLKLFAQLTAYDNILLAASVNNEISSKEVLLMSKQLNVENCLHKQVYKLSFGQRQRIAIIRALAKKYTWLIADEPFSHLDEENTLKAIELIKSSLKQNNAGIILTSLNKDYSFEFAKKLNL